MNLTPSAFSREYNYPFKLCKQTLVLARPESRINDIMEGDVVYVTSDIDREESARIMEHYSLAALPVVDADQHVLGTISLRESIKVAEEEATEDMYHMIGLSGHERIFGPMQDSIKKGFPGCYLTWERRSWLA